MQQYRKEKERTILLQMDRLIRYRVHSHPFKLSENSKRESAHLGGGVEKVKEQRKSENVPNPTPESHPRRIREQEKKEQ